MSATVGSELHALGNRDFTIAGAEASYAPDLALEPIHLALALRFGIEEERAEGTVRTRVRCNRAGSRALVLNAVDLEVQAVDGGPDWRHDGEKLHLTWADPFESGEEREFTVAYSVESPVSGMLFSHPDEAYPDRPLFVATDHETERARYWLPCVDFPTIRTTFEFELTAREGLTILANGRHEGDAANGDGTVTSRWKLEQPCPSYLCCLAIGEFTRLDDRSVDGVGLSYFAASSFEPAILERTFGRTASMLEWIRKRLDAPFPYPKYFQIALPEIGGAMENISLTTWDQVFLLDERLSGEWEHRVDSVNLHEMAHSYFGDAIVCRHFEHTWLKESWAVFMETVYWEETAGTDEGHYDLYVNGQTYMREVDERYARPIVTRTYNASWDLFDAHTYPGGAWRIHMLRCRIGDEGFWAGVRDYVRSYLGRTVETADFRRKLEEHSGLNLTGFFDSWIHGKGYPKLKVEHSFDAEKSLSTLRVRQTQRDEKKGIELFDLPLEIEITGDDGPALHVIDVRDELATVVVPCNGKPSLIRVDPGCKALFGLEFDPGDDLLRHALATAGDVGNRIHAARTLIRSGRRRGLEAVRDAMRDEPFWGVRVAVAQILGKEKPAEAIPVLASMLGTESDPRVQSAVATACGTVRDRRLREALRGFLDGDPPPVARSAALESLGRQRDDSDLERLVEAAGDRGIHHLAASGALRGIGQLRSRAAFDWLRARLPYGELAQPLRPVAAAAFGNCARLLDREQRELAVESLVDLTRDGSERVRLQAAGALAAFGSAAAIPALERLKTLQPAQDGPRIQRWIDAIRKGRPADATAKLEKRVEKLEELCRKLDGRLQDLEANGGD